jgi:hypothetical protein
MPASETLPLPPSLFIHHSWCYQSQEAGEEGTRHHRRLEAVSVVDERQTTFQAEDRLRVGCWQIDTEWTTETGMVFGYSCGLGWRFGDDGDGMGERNVKYASR